jgi:hypothetical protein
LGDRGRRQISTRRYRGIHDQIHVFAHQPQREFRRVVTVFDLLELPRHCGSDYRRLRQDVEQNTPIDLKVLSEGNRFCDCLHIKAEEEIDN